MRRGGLLVLGITGLALSHAGVWRLGSISSAKQSGLDPSRGAAPVGALRGEEDPAFWTPASLARRGAEREEEPAGDENEPEWEEQVAAARRKFPPGGDPAAILAKAIAGLKDEGDDLTAEQTAAFGIWLDRDPAAAFAWLGPSSRDFFLTELGDEVHRWLAGGGYQHLNEYLDRFPLATDSLISAAQELVEERGLAFALNLAGTLQDPGERTNLIYQSISEVEDLSGHVAALRSCLNPVQAGSFLENDLVDFGLPPPALLEEIRKAGFPEKALATYEEWIREKQEKGDEGEVRDERLWQNSSPLAAGQGASRLGIDQVVENAPEFRTWCDEVNAGRLDPAEVMARLLEAWPETPEPGTMEQLRSHVTSTLLETAPVETLHWLHEAGDEREWWAALRQALQSSKVNPEQIAEVVATLPPDTELGVTEERYIGQRLKQWLNEDPQGFGAAEQQMAVDGTTQIMNALMLEQREEAEAQAERKRQRELEEEEESGP